MRTEGAQRCVYNGSHILIRCLVAKCIVLLSRCCRQLRMQSEIACGAPSSGRKMPLRYQGSRYITRENTKVPNEVGLTKGPQ